MKTLAEHLLETRTPEEMAHELALLAKVRAKLLDRVGELEHMLFWMQVRESDTVRALRLENQRLREQFDMPLADISLNGV
jgi:hypothetical protein